MVSNGAGKQLVKDIASVTNNKRNALFNVDLPLIVVIFLFLITVVFGITLVSTLRSIVSYQENSAQYINISGQQRMLSQRLALFSLMYIESGEPSNLEHVQLALQKIRDNLQYLLDESREDVMMSPTLFNIYYRPPLEVRTSLNKYLSAIEKISSVPPDRLNETDLSTEIQYILNNVTPVLIKLDTVVQQYELESVQTVERLRTLELLLIASFLLCSVLILFVFIIPWLKKNREKHALLHVAASSDHLTKLLNRKALSELEEMIFEESKHTNTPLSALMIDIDYFKQVNDQYGHSMGDKVLIAMSNIICKGIRESDYCFRYGGEEFLVVLPQTNLDQALLVAEKIHEHVKAATIENDALSINVTLSIGVSTKDESDDYLNEVIERADIAMYRAKNQGRDRIVHC